MRHIYRLSIVVEAILLLSTFICVNANTCPMFSSTRKSAPHWELQNCTWYQQSACCESTEVDSVFADMQPLQYMSTRCASHINFLMCYFCAPRQSVFYDTTTQRTTVCKSFCDDVYDACYGARSMKNKRLGDVYKSGTEFCEANGFDVLDSTSTYSAKCYSAAGYVLNDAPSLASTSIMASVTMLLTALFRQQQYQIRPNRSSILMMTLCGLFVGSLFVTKASASSVVNETSVIVESRGLNIEKPAEQYCPFFNNRVPQPQPSLQNCTWYRDNSCCDQNEISELLSSLRPLPGANGPCVGALNYLYCYPCAAYQKNYYDLERNTVTICESFCDELYSRCQRVDYKGKRISTRFANGQQFCRALNLFVSSSNDRSDCYGLTPGHTLSNHAILSAPITKLVSILLTFGVLCFSTTTKGVLSSTRMSFKSCNKHAFLILLMGILLLYTSSATAQRVNVSTIKYWANTVGGSIDQLAADLLKNEELQSYYDNADYDTIDKNGANLVTEVQERLSEYFASKEYAVSQLHDQAKHLFLTQSGNSPTDNWINADVPDSQALERLKFSYAFQQRVDSNVSWIKLPDAVHQTNVIDETITWTKDLNNQFDKNYKNDSAIRWQYFGALDGTYRVYPGRQWGNTYAGVPVDYDPRFRPWYLSATSGPKDVVVIIDCSSSMSGTRIDIAKAAAKTVINSLSKDDFVTVICSRDAYYTQSGIYWYTLTYVASCITDRLNPATPSFKKDLINRIDSMQARGSTNMRLGFELAFDMLRSNNVRTHCETIFMVFTDSQISDGSNIRCSPPTRSQNSKSPGRLCKYDYNDALNYVSRNILSESSRIFTYSIYTNRDEFAGILACEIGNGVHQRLNNVTDLRTGMSGYYDYLALSSKSDDIVWTSPYIDANGLGLVITASKSVWDPNNPDHLLGVVGIDSSLQEIEAIMSNERWGSVYAFMININGEALIHPDLVPSDQLKSDPIYPDIWDLETINGKPEGFKDVRDAMMNQKTGSKRLMVDRRVYKGDRREGFAMKREERIYYYAPLNGSDFSFAFVLATPRDIEFRKPLEPSPDAQPEEDWYHRLDKYEDPSYNGPMPSIKHNAGGVYGSLDIIPTASTFKLAANAFCFPERYVQDVRAASFESVFDFINDYSPRPANIGCNNSMINVKNHPYALEDIVRADVTLTKNMDQHWNARSEEQVTSVVWTYVGTSSGIVRFFPGNRLPHTYDPTQRPWYTRAIAQPNITSVSTPYLDAAGAGKVVTLSKPLFTGKTNHTPSDCTGNSRAANCPCTDNLQCASTYCYKGINATDYTCADEQIHGASGVDFEYEQFQSLVFSWIADASESWSIGEKCNSQYSCPADSPAESCETRCYLVDDSGFLIVSKTFAEVPSAQEFEYNLVPFAKQEGWIMLDLQRKGFFKQSSAINFQGTCSITPAWDRIPETTEGMALTPAQQDSYNEFKGKFPPFDNTYGCTQDVSLFSSDETVIPSNGVLQGMYHSDCQGGSYTLTKVPGQNLYMVIVQNAYTNEKPFALGCDVMNRIAAQGAFESTNGTCAEDTQDSDTSLNHRTATCPIKRPYTPMCSYNGAIKESLVHVCVTCIFGFFVTWFLKPTFLH